MASAESQAPGHAPGPREENRRARLRVAVAVGRGDHAEDFGRHSERAGTEADAQIPPSLSPMRVVINFVSPQAPAAGVRRFTGHEGLDQHQLWCEGNEHEELKEQQKWHWPEPRDGEAKTRARTHYQLALFGHVTRPVTCTTGQVTDWSRAPTSVRGATSTGNPSDLVQGEVYRRTRLLSGDRVVASI